MSAVDEALIEAGRLEHDDDVLVLGAGALALGVQRQLGDGWVYVVRSEVDALEQLLGEAHAAGTAGLAYLVGEMPVLPLPDAAVAAALGRADVGAETLELAAAELARVLVVGGRVALAETGGPAADAVAIALSDAGFSDVAVAEVEGEVVVTGTRT